MGSARADAPQLCPALEPLDFEALVAPEVSGYARAHLCLYRWWRRRCSQGQNTLGQAQMLKLMDRGGLLGAGALFQDRVSAELWLSRLWRDVTGGAFGLNLPQFVGVAGKLGQMLVGDVGTGAVDATDVSGLGHIEGVLEFVNRIGPCDAD